jgi:DNA-binding MarR family transcriptional regulator
MAAKQDGAPARPYLRTLLLRRSEWMESRVLEAAGRNGYGAVTPAMNRLFGHMRSKPVGISDLARQLGVSRQAVHEVVRQAEELGLVELVSSDEDARVKLVRFTKAGWAMSDSAARELQAIERELADLIGERDLETLRRILGRAWSEDELPAAQPVSSLRA